MRISVKRVGGLAVAMCVVATAWGQSDKLKEAIDLYDQQDYAAAQERLLEVDRDKLTEAEKDELDAYLKDAPGAIKAAEKAGADGAEADKAFDAGRWDEAEKHYRGVLKNPTQTRGQYGA